MLAAALLLATLPAASRGQTAVYYSVGTDTGDLNSATAPTITIAGGVATFSVSQPDNVGVGDRITYDGAAIAFISGRTSAFRLLGHHRHRSTPAACADSGAMPEVLSLYHLFGDPALRLR